MRRTFEKVLEKVSFPKEEEKMLEYWGRIRAFETQLKLTEDGKEYTFYDGPPFATGLPHYGNLLAGTVKDICTRYASQNGFHVKRRFGWDCHGLPVEYEIDKQLGLSTPRQHEEFGIKQYNDECRKIVMRYSTMWRDVVGRFGRWIDFDNDYKTMDLGFMESVWWIFRQLFDKGLVYRSSRVMPFSTACNTVLSNFEANSNYKENVPDPSVFVSFPLVNKPEVKLIAWTTTPWTLPSNLALAINPELDYVQFVEPKSKDMFVCGEAQLENLKKEMKIGKDVKLEMVAKFKGKEMIGWEYVPLFDYFASHRERGCFRVVPADYVTATDGTGIVHTAPGFGEDDFNVCVKHGLISPDAPPCPVDASGVFVDPVTDFKGKYIKDADPLIKEYLKKQKRMVASSTIKHNYPYCWRSDTPLIYKAVQAWFIKVTSLKKDMIANNMKAKWVPPAIQEKRFHNWLEEARDWCFSRNRYWGNPIPLWVSDDLEEIVCVGSIKELEELTGAKGPITDLHRDCIDHLTIPSKKGKGVLRRIPEVFDCWFESGSMPFAQSHYPFGISEEDFNKIFPADFCAEGLDQTRGWFYTLLVLSTALRNENCFKNLIVHGLILAKDGKKMSKRLHNYTDPKLLANKNGADAIRLYMINSPVVKAESLRFKDEGVEACVRDIILPWFNSYRFLIQNITRWEILTGRTFVFDQTVKQKMKNPTANIMDKWITAASQNLIKFIRQEMESYRLYTVVPRLLKFLEQLTNWYVRLNRNRLKGVTTPEDWSDALNILFDVLLSTTLMLSPYAPFTSEFLYQNLKNGVGSDSKLFADSIHFLMMPQFEPSLIDEEIERKVSQMQGVIVLGRLIRDRKKLPVKQPLQKLTLISKDAKLLAAVKELASYIAEELNVFEMEYKDNETDFVTYKVSLNYEAVGERLGKAVIKDLKELLPKLSNDELRGYVKEKQIKLGTEFELVEGELVIEPTFIDEYAKNPELGCASNLESCVLLDVKITEELNRIRISRELANHIQKARKEGGVNIEDAINVFYTVDGVEAGQVVRDHLGGIKQVIKVPFVELKHMPKYARVVCKDQYETVIGGNSQTILYLIAHAHLAFDEAAIAKRYPKLKGSDVTKAIRKVLALPYTEMRKQMEDGKLGLEIDGTVWELKQGSEVFGSLEEMLRKSLPGAK